MCPKWAFIYIWNIRGHGFLCTVKDPSSCATYNGWRRYICNGVSRWLVTFLDWSLRYNWEAYHAHRHVSFHNAHGFCTTCHEPIPKPRPWGHIKIILTLNMLLIIVEKQTTFHGGVYFWLYLWKKYGIALADIQGNVPLWTWNTIMVIDGSAPTWRRVVGGHNDDSFPRVYTGPAWQGLNGEQFIPAWLFFLAPLA